MSEFLAILLAYGTPLLLIGFGFFVGGWRERSHLRALDLRETAASDVTITNLKTIPRPETVTGARLVSGNVVIATDYFKTFATQLRGLVGGELKAAQSLLLRARREALMRMVDDAREFGAAEVCNVRFQFCSISQMSGKKGAMSVEMYAYGTAVIRRPS